MGAPGREHPAGSTIICLPALPRRQPGGRRRPGRTPLARETTMTFPAPDTPPLEVETGPAPAYSVIWLHGLGADGGDFAPVVPHLGLPGQPALRFVFPHAPFRPVTCNGGYVMRAWYDIISLAPDSREIDEAGLIESRAIVRQLIARENARGVPSERIILAGFSQGGAVAYLSGLTHPTPLAGIIALSTYIPSPALLSAELSEANRQIPIFAAHGSEDDVVSPGLGRQAVELVQALGLAPEWRTYPLPHSVSLEEIADIGAWLRRTWLGAAY
jgi:phospholipase/carboxylesterase